MGYRISFKDILATLIIGTLIFCFAFYKCDKKENESVTYFFMDDVLKWETVEMEVTAYCPCVKCCDDWGKIPVSSGKRKTAGGHIIKEGDKFIAADRRYPFHTKMIIIGYNNNEPVEVLDRGGAIKGNCVDVFFNTHQEALNWGRKKNLSVYVAKLILPEN